MNPHQNERDHVGPLDSQAMAQPWLAWFGLILPFLASMPRMKPGVARKLPSSAVHSFRKARMSKKQQLA